MVKAKNSYEGNLHRRFVVRVLAPPFIALLVLSAGGLWQLGKLLRNQAISELQRSAETTAGALDREFTLRETIQKRTGSELFLIKSEYQAARTKLDQNHDACAGHIRLARTFQNSPAGVCEPFLGGLASTRGGLLQALEDEYVELGEDLVMDQDQRINERLSAFKQFFPETLALVIVDTNKQVSSLALSGAFKGSAEAFRKDAESALALPIYAKQTTVEAFGLSVFAFPITHGSVLAAYETHNPQFIQQTWQRAPIDRTRALVVMLDADNNVAYPGVKNSEQFKNIGVRLRDKPSTQAQLDRIDHTAVGAEAGASGWLVVVASPTAAVLAALRDTQLLGIVAIGLFMVGFAWVGSFFIQRTLRNIVSLVSGAMIFGSGRLDYKIVLDHADNEFVRLGETMNLMAQRIAQAEKELDEKNQEFISVATHEIRAPLTSIIGHLSVLQEVDGSKLSKHARTMTDEAYYGAVRLRDLVNDMLNVARLESDRSQFSLAPIDVKPVISEVVGIMGVVANIAKVSLHYDDTHATFVSADEGRLRIIINNFVSNAIKYNRPNGKVNVVHSIKDSMLVTAVTDTGLGIPEDQKARMFEKFFRVEHEDRKSVTGTGLGMYIVKQYAEQMGGKVWFESAHGKGSTFYVSLPIVKTRLRARVANRLKRITKLGPRRKKRL